MRPTVIAFALVLSATAASDASAQTPRDEDVIFRNGAITIAGTLSLPAGAGPFAAVVLLSGSGPQDRDSDLLGFKPFKLIAESFVAARHCRAAMRRSRCRRIDRHDRRFDD